MGAIGGALSGTVSVARPTTQKIYHLSIVNSATEYSQALSPNTKMFLIRNQNNGILQFTLTSGESGTDYITIKPRAVYTTPQVNLSSATIYIQSNLGSQTVEIEEWT